MGAGEGRGGLCTARNRMTDYLTDVTVNITFRISQSGRLLIDEYRAKNYRQVFTQNYIKMKVIGAIKWVQVPRFASVPQPSLVTSYCGTRFTQTELMIESPIRN